MQLIVTNSFNEIPYFPKFLLFTGFIPTIILLNVIMTMQTRYKLDWCVVLLYLLYLLYLYLYLCCYTCNTDCSGGGCRMIAHYDAL